MTALIGNPLLLTSAPAAGGDDAYQIEKSLRFNSADTPKLSRPFSLGNIRTLTWSGWVKRNKLGAKQSIFGAPDTGNTTDIEFDSSDRLIFTDGASVYAQTTAVFRDPSAWYHIVFALDANAGVLADRCKLYVNGKLQDVTTQNYGQAGSTDFGTAGVHTVGSSKDVYSDTLLADVQYIDGLALSPAAFGEFDSTGTWNPKAFALPAPNKGVTHSSTLTSSSGWNYGAPADVFDGLATESSSVNPTSGHTATWKPATEIEGQTFEIYCKVEDGTATDHLTVNGISYYNDVYSQLGNNTWGWATLNGLRSINTTQGLTFKRTDGNKQCAISAIRVDGVILVDGQTDPTTRTNLNNGTKWSDYLVSSTGSFHGSMAKTQGFDGNGLLATDADSQGATITWTPPSVITFTGSVELKCGGDQAGTQTITLTDSSDATTTLEATNESLEHFWTTVKTGGGTLKSLALAASAGAWGTWYGLRIDGHVLVDSSVDNSFHIKFNDISTNARLGRNSFNKGIEDSSVNGALPIYNTTADSDGYDNGETKGSGYRADSSAGTTDGTGLILAIPGDTLTDYASFADEHVDDAATAFDGSLTGTYATAGGGTTGTFTFTGSKFTGITKLRIYGKYDSRDNAADSKILVNDEDIQVGSSAGWVTATEHLDSGTLNTIKIVSSSYNTALYAIEIDDVVVQTGDDLDVHASINTGSSAKALLSKSVTVDTTASRLYGSSLQMNAQTDGISVTSENSDFAFGTGDFTIEMWVNQNGGFTLYDDRPASTNGNYVMLGLSNTSFTFRQDDTDRITATIPGNNTGWKHLAAVRNSGTTKLYCNGKEVGSWSDSTNYISGGANRPRIGHNGYADPGNYATTGSYQDIRVYKGVAKYTANFTPPTRNDFTVSNLQTVGASGTTYSSSGTWAYSPSGPHVAGSEKNAFDGDSTTSVAHALTTDGYVEYTFPSAITVSSKLEVDYYNPDGYNIVTYYKINSEAERQSESPSGNNHFYSELKNSSGGTWTGSLTKIKLRLTRSGANSHANLYGIKVDGNVLLDGTSDAGKDISTDSPTNYGTDTGNYCTLNPLDFVNTDSSTLTQGNLTATGPSTDSNFAYAAGTLAINSADTDGYYFEVTWEKLQSAYNGLGFLDVEQGLANKTSTQYHIGHGSHNSDLGVTIGDSHLFNYGTTLGRTGANWGASGDVAQVAIKGNKIWWGKNNTWFNDGSGNTGNPATGANPMVTLASAKTLTPVASLLGNSGRPVGHFNFGQRAFKYTAPSGFKSLCTQNLDNLFDSEDSENDPSYYFDISTWTGTGAEQTIDNLKFQPDAVWVKVRDNTDHHAMFDAVRGATKKIYPSDGAGEVTDAQTIKSFDSDGFTVGTEGGVNLDTKDFVGFSWDAGTAANTSGLTDGSINISSGNQWVNNTAGFSITKYTGTEAAATISHGLTAPPEFVMVKNLTGYDWVVGHSQDGESDAWGHGLELNDQNAQLDTDGFWNDTDPTNSLLHLKGATRTNGPSHDMIAYCWTPIEGYSRFGLYTGNNSADGSFVYCGFRPSWVLIKHRDTTTNWQLFDDARDLQNPTETWLEPNSSGIEQTHANVKIDLLSNGFKLRGNDSGINASAVYVFAAFAEHPFKTARAR